MIIRRFNLAEINPNNVRPVFKNKYYVYALCKPNGEVFYIGKGKGKRINHHFNDWHLNKSNNKKNQTIRKYGNSIKREILCYFDNEDSAYEYEEWLISYYGIESEGGCLRQYAKSRYQYADCFKKVASEQSRKKTTPEIEEMVVTVYKMYFTDCENKYFISEHTGISFNRIDTWVKGVKHKVLYNKYMSSGIIIKNREITQEFKLDKRFKVKELRQDRLDWLNGKPTNEISHKYGTSTMTILSLFYGDSCRGLFHDYSEVPERYLKRKNKSKCLEDRIY